MLCTPWVALYSICIVNNTKNKEAGKFSLLANSRINCRFRVEKNSVFVRSAVGALCRRLVVDRGTWFWEKMGGGGVLSELIALWWTVIVGFQNVSIRLSPIVRQRIGIDRTLVISLIKHLVTIIRLKKRRDFSIAEGTAKKSLHGIANYRSQVTFFPDAKRICLSFMKGILINLKYLAIFWR